MKEAANTSSGSVELPNCRCSTAPLPFCHLTPLPMRTWGGGVCVVLCVAGVWGVKMWWWWWWYRVLLLDAEAPEKIRRSSTHWDLSAPSWLVTPTPHPLNNSGVEQRALSRADMVEDREQASVVRNFITSDIPLLRNVLFWFISLSKFFSIHLWSHGAISWHLLFHLWVLTLPNAEFCLKASTTHLNHMFLWKNIIEIISTSD